MDHRRIVLFLLCVLFCEHISCIQYTPVDVDDITNCALILPNNEQYSSDLLRSDFGGPVNCITYDAINQAYLEARKRIAVPEIEDEVKVEDVGAVGQLILDISQQIAREYELNQDEIEERLPTINTLKTLINNICPAYLSSISCTAGKYRRHDGLCNNVDNPSWGATMTTFTRFLPPNFADYLSSPRVSTTGNSLPLPRIVSRKVHVDAGYHDQAITVMMVAWGQFMDHDFTLMGTPFDPRTRNDPEDCCERPEHLKHQYCMEIKIPEDDYFYAKFNQRCQNFVRTFPGVKANCKLGSKTPFNTLTSVIDGNTVYGASETHARQLRAGIGGKLRMNPAFSHYGLKDLLPLKTDIPEEGCTRTNSSQFCFLAGEIRVNEQLALTCVHTLMAREHNRVAEELAVINPHWDDETLYQEARRITIAEIQHITFNEFLPMLLGKEVMEKYGLTLTSEGYWNGYNPEVNPGILDAFSAAAFRFGHSLLPSALERWSKLHKFIASKRLSDLIRRPYDLYRAGVIDEYFMGMANQPAQCMDEAVTQEVTNNLLKKPGHEFGLDLISFNIQRGRDFGIPGYMFYKQHCGYKTADTFEEMSGNMANSTIYAYKEIYQSPWDIDLWSGGVSENPLQGSMLGPTFACIIANQMSMIRQGDRFWYELPDQPSSFSPAQLKEIRKTRLSRILCDNSDLIDTVQIYAMVMHDNSINPRIPCKSSVLPRMDLSHWADPPTRSFADKATPKQTSFVKTSAIDTNKTLSPSAYEYHVKTIAIIEGSSPPVNANSLLTGKHKVFKRETNATTTESSPVKSNSTDATEPVTSPTRIRANITRAALNRTSLKDLSKRYSHQPSRKIRQQRSRSMTQAIIKDDSGESGNRRKFYPVDDEQDIESFFRKNVPIYDGVPAALRTNYRGRDYKDYPSKDFTKDDVDDDEDEDKPMKGLLEVSEDHDSEYEHVPMTIDEFGRQKVTDTADEEEDDFHKPFPYQSSGFSDDDSPYTNDYDKPHNHPYPFDSGPSPYKDDDFGSSPYKDDDSGPSPYKSHGSGSSYRTYEPDHSHLFSDLPPKYGTSHQYNSLADDEPRYYKHFVPSIRGQQSSSFDEDERPYSHYSAPTRFSKFPSSSGSDSDDFTPTNGPYGGSYIKYPRRTTHVPRTLEEYHRIHKTFEKSRPTHRHRRPIIVPQEDKDEEDEEEKEKDGGDSFDGPKSFVSLNFKPPGSDSFSDDERFSVRHQIGHSRPRFRRPYSNSGGSSAEQDSPDFNSDTFRKEPGGFRDSADSIKSYVDSIFSRNRNPDFSNKFSTGKQPLSGSPFNPHFGERVTFRGKPTQNVLWHRQAAESRDVPFRSRASRNKNDRNILEENVKHFDDLVKELDFKPSKRDINRREGQSGEEGDEVDVENAEESEPLEAVSSAEQKASQEDDSPKESSWSESYSEPN